MLRPFVLVAFLKDCTGEAGALPAAGITQIGWKQEGMEELAMSSPRADFGFGTPSG